MRRLLCSLPLLIVLGCQGPDDGFPGISRVAIVGVEEVESPRTGRERAYIPDIRWTVNREDGGEVEAAGFHISIDTTSPPTLQMRLSVDGEHVPLSVMSGDAPPDWDAAAGHAEITAALREGHGVFWPDGSPSAGGLTHRYAVVLPAGKLRPRTLLQVYASTTESGAPLGGDAIELATGFFYMAAIGDSAMWGNGLREADKFSSLVARAIEEARGVRVIREVHAVSGASIVPLPEDNFCPEGCTGEAPRYYTSITLQALRLPEPERLDLLLVDGCGNDISLGVVLAITDNTEEIERRAERYCHGAMANLLLLLRTLAPQTPIVVTGYFPFVSESTDLSRLGTWAASQGIDLGNVENFAPYAKSLIANSEAFVELTRENLQRAVDFAVAITGAAAPIVYADAGYTAENAIFAANSWLWGLTIDEQIAATLGFDLPFVPEDPLLNYRTQACSNGPTAPSLLTCLYGSLAHPNPAGARAYADAILARLEEIGLLPTGSAGPESPQ